MTSRVEGEDKSYLIHIGDYAGTAGDSMNSGSNYNINGMKFTTFDKDNANCNCGGKLNAGGWWYDW